VDEGGEPDPDSGGVPLVVSGKPPPLEDGVVCSSVGMEGTSPTMARAHAGMPASAAAVPKIATRRIRFMEQGMAMRSLLFARDATLMILVARNHSIMAAGAKANRQLA
jgi:hypothetical protein